MFLVLGCLLLFFVPVFNRQSPTIYEVSTRPWLYSLSQKYGRNISRLVQVPIQEFQAIANLGVEYLWLMGVWQLGPYGLNHDRTDPDLIQSYNQVLPGWTTADVIGSPYAIVNFTCNPSICSDIELALIKKQVNALGLKLMLDFVPNHAAYDSLLVNSSINMFMRAPPNTPTPYNPNTWFPNGVYYAGDQYDRWNDVAQFNYWNTTTYNYMKDVLAKIAKMADAIRCDMAMLIMNQYFYQDWSTPLNAWGYKQPATEFWSDAIANAKKINPNLLMMAEVYWGANQAILNLGFDLVYDKDLLDAMASKNAQNVRNYIQSQSISYLKKSNHFIENHDEPRAVALFGADYIANTAAMIAYTLPGAKFINDGQILGYKNKLDVHLRRAVAENGTDYARWWYSRLLPIINQEIFHSGTWTYLNVNGNNIGGLLAWKWTNATDRRLVAVNFGSSQAYGQIVLTDASAPAGKDIYNITELMSGNVYQRSATQMRTVGLGVLIDAWNGQIFQY